MKKSISSAAAWAAAAIASVGTAHADNLTLRIVQPTLQQVEMLRDLLANNLIQRTGEDSTFQVNHEALEAQLELEARGDAEAHRLADSLRGICGKGTDIRQVGILGFSHGTQDV